MNHIERMAKAISEASGGGYPPTFLAQAAFDALIDAVPDLVWVDQSENDRKSIVSEFEWYEISRESGLWYLEVVVAVGRSTRRTFISDISPDKSINLMKAAANTHRRTQVRKIWDGE